MSKSGQLRLSSRREKISQPKMIRQSSQRHWLTFRPVTLNSDLTEHIHRKDGLVSQKDPWRMEALKMDVGGCQPSTAQGSWAPSPNMCTCVCVRACVCISVNSWVYLWWLFTRDGSVEHTCHLLLNLCPWQTLLINCHFPTRSKTSFILLSTPDSP